MTGVQERIRLGWVDGLRGLAVLLMVLDHVLVNVEPGHWLRYTVTRAALPLFMFCAAVVWKPLSRRRMGLLGAAAAAEMILGPLAGLRSPGIVALIVGCLLLVEVGWVRRNLPLVAAVGLVQALYLPVPWEGYQPGLVLVWLTLGLVAHLWEGRLLVGVGDRAPGWVVAVGRRPLVWYLGHLVVLGVVFL